MSQPGSRNLALVLSGARARHPQIERSSEFYTRTDADLLVDVPEVPLYGRWAERNRDVLDLEAAELGLRLLIA